MSIARAILYEYFLIGVCRTFKGTVSRDLFLLLVFFMNQFPPQPQSIPLGLIRVYSKIRGDIRSTRLTTGVVDTGGKRKRSLIRKMFKNFLGHLWIVELTYCIYKFLPSSSL